MNSEVTDLEVIIRPLHPKLVRLKHGFVSFAYLFVFVALVWSAFFEVSASLTLLIVAASVLAMHFELSYRIDLLNHVCAALYEQLKTATNADEPGQERSA